MHTIAVHLYARQLVQEVCAIIVLWLIMFVSLPHTVYFAE